MLLKQNVSVSPDSGYSASGVLWSCTCKNVNIMHFLVSDNAIATVDKTTAFSLFNQFHFPKPLPIALHPT